MMNKWMRALALVLALMLAGVPALADMDGEMIVGKSGLRERTLPESGAAAKVTTGLVLDEHEKVLAVGDTYTLKGTVTRIGPADPYKYKIYYADGTKDDTPNAQRTCVRYANKGLDFKAVGEGIRIIELISGACSDRVTVTVVSKPTEVELDRSAIAIPVGGSDSLLATVQPTLGSQKVTWTSSKKAVATVSKTGMITAKKAGTTTITAKTPNGKKASCTVTVAAAPAVESTRRALVIGAGVGQQKDRTMFPLDAKQFANMLRLNTFSGKSVSVKLLSNPTKKAAVSAIKTYFKKATANDVSYIYLMCHGEAPANGQYKLWIGKDASVTAAELRALLDTYVQGTKVLVINSCFAGDVINKGVSDNWARGFVSQFNAAASKSGDMIGEGYKVLCGVNKSQSSWVVGTLDNKAAWNLAGCVVSKGAGWNYRLDSVSTARRCEMLADANADNQVTLGEMYAYAEPELKALFEYYKKAGDISEGSASQLCAYPENDDFVLFARN